MMIKSLRCRIRIWLSVCFLWFVNKEWKPGQSSRSILHYHCNAKIENTRINQRASGEREKGLLDCLNQAKYVVFHNVQKRSCAAFEFENLCNQVGTVVRCLSREKLLSYFVPFRIRCHCNEQVHVTKETGERHGVLVALMKT